MRRALADTGPLVALLNRNDTHHERARGFFRRFDGVLITTWPVLTEASHLLPLHARAGFVRWVARGGVMLQELPADQISTVPTLMEGYADNPMDLADASLICLAEAIGIADIITVDQAGFDTYRTGAGKRFKNLFLP